MIALKNLGICMDHSNAHLMEFTVEPAEIKSIGSKFTHEDKMNSLAKSESLMHNKEQHAQSEYYKKLGEVIKNYDDVVLFGPTEAKTELLNLLRGDHSFSKIKIEIEHTDKMSESQQHAFVKNYFSK